MRFVVLAEKSVWHVEDLRRAAVARGHALVTCSWRSMQGAVAADQPRASSEGIILDHADAVLVRTMPVGTLEQVVFRMDVLHRLEAMGKVTVNPPRAIETGVDKYLALCRMEQAGVATPPTVVCQRAVDALEAFAALGGDVIVKPLFGAEGFGLMRVSDIDLARRAFLTLERLGHVIYVQRFIAEVAHDARLFVIDGRVVASMERVSADWRRNIARGGSGAAFEADDALCDLAVRAAGACHAVVAGVDVLVTAAGERFVLEVNASPGWRALGKVTGADIASRIVEYAALRCITAQEAVRDG